MSEKIYQPSDALKPFVKSFAIRLKEMARNFDVLPCTGFIVGFQFSGKISYLNKCQSISLGSA
jgi:hypothetical protein